MFCGKCGVQLLEGSPFCTGCGASQKQVSGAPAAPVPEPPEQTLWNGRYSAWALAHAWILWFLWILGVSYLYMAYLDGYGPLPGLFCLASAVLPAAGIAVQTLFRKLTTRYRLTNQRLFRERGLVSRRINELELIRIDDVSVSQNIVQRIFNVGAVTILSTDASDPRLQIEGIDNPIAVKEQIRTCVQKRRQRIVNIESV